jgi:hypothetical protein
LNHSQFLFAQYRSRQQGAHLDRCCAAWWQRHHPWLNHNICTTVVPDNRLNISQKCPKQHGIANADTSRHSPTFIVAVLPGGNVTTRGSTTTSAPSPAFNSFTLNHLCSTINHYAAWHDMRPTWIVAVPPGGSVTTRGSTTTSAPSPALNYLPNSVTEFKQLA